MIKKNFTTALLILLLTFSILINVFLYLNPQSTYSYQSNINKIYYSNKTATQLEVEDLQNVRKQSINNQYVTGWIPDWDLPDGFNTLKAQKNTFNSISPFWFTPNDDGSLKEIANKVNPEIISFTKANGIKLIPSIFQFDYRVLVSILNSKENLQRHVQDIISKIDKYDLDGIDLDYEEISLSDKKFFFEFLEKLSTEMKKNGKILSITVLPKWGNELTYPNNAQTRLVQDYGKISNYADEFRIMTYDFFGKTTTEAGPIGPLTWLERTIQYAINEGVPRSKIILGIHTYAYDWSDRPLASSVDLVNWYGNLSNIQGLEVGTAYYYSTVEDVMKKYELKYEFFQEWGEAVGRYIFNGKQRIVVFPTQQSIDLRKQLAKDYGLKGIAIWRVGDEGSLRY